MLIRNLAGFTLFELVITLSIVLTLQLCMLPSFHHVFIQNQTDAIIDRIKMSLTVARIEAVERQSTVRFCASQDYSKCAGDWWQGQIILDLKNGEILHVYPRLPTGYRLIWKSAFQRNHSVDFNSEGFTRAQQGTFYCCVDDHHNSRYSRGLVVSQSGRVRALLNVSKLRKVCLG